MTYHIDLSTITLANGAHIDRESGMCLLEAVAYFAGESHSDRPACTSPVLGSFGRALNDALPVDKRQRLVSFVPRMVGTAGDGLDEARSYLALDWLIRTYTPTWLDLAGLTVEAQALRDLRRIVDLTSVRAAGLVICEGATKARAAVGDATRAVAGAAAWDAAWIAVRRAAWDAAWAAARDAARDAAWAVAGDAAWDAAWIAVRRAAWDAVRRAVPDTAGAVPRAAARDAAWVAAWAAAWTAARAAARDATRVVARDATREAAKAALAPTVDLLQDSAIALLDAMITPLTQ